MIYNACSAAGKEIAVDYNPASNDQIAIVILTICFPKPGRRL